MNPAKPTAIDPMSPTTPPPLSRDELAGAEILQRLRAQTETEAELDELKEAARLAGEEAYHSGPGRKRQRDWESLPETDPVFRREKKTRSAYVSRFKAAAYKKLLEDRVNGGVRTNENIRADLNHLMLEHTMLKERIRILSEKVARKEASSEGAPQQPAEEEHSEPESEVEDEPEDAPVKVPLSPVSPGSSVLEAPMQDVPYPEIALEQDPFALLPPSYTKIYPIEEWSDDLQGELLFAQ